MVRRGRSILKACESDDIDQESQVVQSNYQILPSANTNVILLNNNFSEITQNDTEIIPNDYPIEAVNESGKTHSQSMIPSSSLKLKFKEGLKSKVQPRKKDKQLSFSFNKTSLDTKTSKRKRKSKRPNKPALLHRMQNKGKTMILQLWKMETMLTVLYQIIVESTS